ncbi:MAG: hypothetical protein LBC74_09575 [Planctomycetaceae bacterium]|jgi:hypothetical protein|nr:hypothetical protein [Planctomycetaceae bacterium]
MDNFTVPQQQIIFISNFPVKTKNTKKPADETTDKIKPIIEENVGATSKPKSDNRSERIRRAIGSGLQIYNAVQGMKK